ncbi:Eco57I restriction-modification methylase domain-containing protein [Pseudomonas aeruginosa]|uniref:Eco57I restriction-modification methylase domain-containing protein n=1 Tax=Pseudomonas aeruginosa TaxID=287 RepID=UPI0009369157|nr:Eco57I restriction-modification methylase domain-containing protein [Pseudomonas aeruginosa]MBG4296334.1 Eco57I restriction-modification methylase domain-containing protein [Pseudomonas aeruginosa]MBH9455852.1 Eco57I restriction-modification methylase domain-containing protein [Pseudomonas aeruginosa]MBH9464046.1 Eco57I restriction-modification methylase domain-containing protein [Pseudomonas aeruginosa]MCT5232755.1 Eco57I restriction-modification methylase domain-containing protein [Pseudom
MQLSLTERVRFQRFCRTLSACVAEGHAPDELARALLAQWMNQATPQLASPTCDGAMLRIKAVIRFVEEWLLPRDTLTGAFWLSSAYAVMVGKAQRKQQAMYFTSPHLALRLIDAAAESLLEGPIVDPACGGAAFLAPAADRIARRLQERGGTSEEILAYIEANVHGTDIDPLLCELSTGFLRMVLAEHITAAGREPNFIVAVDDGLSSPRLPVSSYRLVLCNPPYRKMTAAEAQPYRAELGQLMLGQPNLYTLFIGRAMKLLQEGGSAVFLTPMSFVSGRSFSALRQALSSTGHVRQVDLIHDKYGIFLSAEQDAAITVWQKDAGADAATQVNLLATDGTWQPTGEVRLPAGDAPWLLPRSTADAQLLPLFTSRNQDLIPEHTLTTYGYVPRTGQIVIHRDKRQRYAKRLHIRKGACVVPMIWQSDISKAGVLTLAEGSKTQARYIEVGSDSTAHVVRRPTVAVQRVTSDDQAHRLVCAPVPQAAYDEFGGVVGENHVCLIEQNAEGGRVDAETLCAILRTRTVDRLFRIMSGVTNVSAYELQLLPLPDPDVVLAHLAAGSDIESAVRAGFGLAPVIVSCSKWHDQREGNHGENQLDGEVCCG